MFRRFSRKYRPKGKEMVCICYICGIQYGEKPPFDNDQITHGLFEPCFHMEMIKIEKIKRIKKESSALKGKD